MPCRSWTLVCPPQCRLLTQSRLGTACPSPVCSNVCVECAAADGQHSGPAADTPGPPDRRSRGAAARSARCVPASSRAWSGSVRQVRSVPSAGHLPPPAPAAAAADNALAQVRSATVHSRQREPMLRASGHCQRENRCRVLQFIPRERTDDTRCEGSGNVV